jgi:hypothetical protein
VTPDYSTWHEETLRVALQQLHQAAADSLSAVRYWHDGPHWAEWLRGVLGEAGAPVTLEGVRYVLGLLDADVRSHMLAGRMPTPELRAQVLVWRYGAEDALMALVGPAWARGELPEENVAWLLLHPERIPANFPLYCEVS